MRRQLPISKWRFTNIHTGEIVEIHAKTLKGAKGIIKRTFNHSDEFFKDYGVKKERQRVG